MQTFIEVSYDYHTTAYSIRKALAELSEHTMLSYDCEAQSQYSLEEKAEAKLLLKDSIDDLSPEDIRLCKLVAGSNGLSYPEIVKTTHFIFGTSESHSVILIANDMKTEQIIRDWLVAYTGKLLIHNALFDLKQVYLTTGKFPIDFEDTQLLAKTYLNHTETWKANSGLKHLMAQYYDPRWEHIETYDIVDYKDPDFLRYCAVDGAATWKLYHQLLEHKEAS